VSKLAFAWCCRGGIGNRAGVGNGGAGRSKFRLADGPVTSAVLVCNLDLDSRNIMSPCPFQYTPSIFMVASGSLLLLQEHPSMCLSLPKVTFGVGTKRWRLGAVGRAGQTIFGESRFVLFGVTPAFGCFHRLQRYITHQNGRGRRVQRFGVKDAVVSRRRYRVFDTLEESSVKDILPSLKSLLRLCHAE